VAADEDVCRPHSDIINIANIAQNPYGFDIPQEKRGQEREAPDLRLLNPAALQISLRSNPMILVLMTLVPVILVLHRLFYNRGDDANIKAGPFL
jgi:hypothetical protein